MVIMYVDDTILLSNSKGGWQKRLEDLTVNGDRTKVSVFGHSKSRNVSLKYNGEELVYNFNGKLRRMYKKSLNI